MLAINGNTRAKKDFAVALVYPPYGPSAVASLGLAILSAGIRARGFACRTFYWNLDFVRELPGNDLASQLSLYQVLSQRPLMPFNEWVFGEVLHGDRMAELDREVPRYLEAWTPPTAHWTISKSDLLHLRSRAPEVVVAMTDQLAAFDVVGINSTFFQNVPALALAKAVKARWPNKIVVMGGANCDGPMGRTLLAQYPFLDYVFTGEVDHAFPELVTRLANGERDSVADLRGIIFRSGAYINHGLPPAPLEDLNGLPIPDFDDYVAARSRLGMDADRDLCLPLESSRGCWWGAKQHCTFCGLNANGMGYRQKSADRFHAEVETIVKQYGARYIFMADNILSTNYYRDFLDWAIEKDLGVDFFYEIKANVTRSQIEKLARARVSFVQPGIESFSTPILQRMRKGITEIKNIAFLKYAREYGILATYNLLAGFPGEERDEYGRMARNLPMLMHLQPPSGLSAIEYHRFSPYHYDASRYGLQLEASPKYRYLHPFSQTVLDQLAYMFEPRSGTEVVDRSYLDELRAQVHFWQEHFNADDCTLSWAWSGMDIVIEDRRPRLPARRYVLQGFAVAVFRSTDDPISIRSLTELANGTDCNLDASEVLSMMMTFTVPANSMEERTIAFTKSEFLQDPSGCLRQFVDVGLLYVEDDKYLALPVRDAPPAVVREWYRLGI
jgi:ribosomal peptide maturation radical SAM protein 1